MLVSDRGECACSTFQGSGQWIGTLTEKIGAAVVVMHSLYVSIVVKRTEHESQSVDLPVLVPTLPYGHEFCVGTESERP